MGNDITGIDKETELSFEVFVSLFQAFRAVSEHTRRDIETYGLNPTEFSVLELLLNKGPQPVQGIGEMTLLASGSITYVLDKLESRGYLRRQQSLEDKRVSIVSLTEEGTKFITHIFPQHLDLISSVMTDLSTEERRMLQILLRKLRQSANKL